MLVYGLITWLFLFSILLSSYLDFCEKNSKKIMKSGMGILSGESGPL